MINNLYKIVKTRTLGITLLDPTEYKNGFGGVKVLHFVPGGVYLAEFREQTNKYFIEDGYACLLGNNTRVKQFIVSQDWLRATGLHAFPGGRLFKLPGNNFSFKGIGPSVQYFEKCVYCIRYTGTCQVCHGTKLGDEVAVVKVVSKKSNCVSDLGEYLCHTPGHLDINYCGRCGSLL